MPDHSSPDKHIRHEKVRIPVTELMPGMYVSELDRPWLDSPFIYQGFYLLSQEDIEEVQAVCEYVYIDTTREQWEETSETKRHGKTITTRKTRERTQYVTKAPLATEMPRARLAFNDAKAMINSIMTSIRLGEEIDVKAIERCVDTIVDSILANPDALSWLSQIKNKDDYTAEHSLRVCILSASLARHLGFLEEEIRMIGLCGMLHDIGKVRVPDSILNKTGALTPEEFQQMKLHTTEGKKILLSQKGVPHAAVDVAFSHHERLNGKGYPRQLSARQIPLYAKMVAITDAFDAITSSRCYKEGISALEALRILYDDMDSHFDPELTQHFIKMIGIYPIGHIAELNSGEVGIIVGHNQTDSKLLPKVLVVLDGQKVPCQEKIYDLSKPLRTKDGRPLRLKKLHPNHAFGIDLDLYVEKGLKLSQPPASG